VGVEPFGVAERDCGVGKRGATASGPHLRIEVRFMKSRTPSPEEKRADRAVGSTCWNRRHSRRWPRGVRADEDRAGIADAAGDPLGVGGRDFKMLGRNGIDERQRLVEVPHQKNSAKITPRVAGNFFARQVRNLCSTARSTASASSSSSAIRIAWALASCSLAPTDRRQSIRIAACIG